MNWQFIKFRVYWWSKKIILNGLFALIVLFIFSFVLLQLPSVQTALTSKVLKGFSEVSGFDISYDRFYFLWYDRLEIENLQILDPQKNIMIGAERIQLNFEFSKLWKKNQINIDGATVRGAQVNLITIPGRDSTKHLNINIWIDEIGRQFASEKPGGTSPIIRIGEVVLDQASFSYNDTEEDSIRQGFDYRHFRVGVSDGEVENFQVKHDTVQLQVRSLVAQDQKTKLDIHELQTFFRFSQRGMEFLKMNLKAGKSVVSDSVSFSYRSSDDFKDFNKLVVIRARLKGTVIDHNDLALFAPGVDRLGQPLHLDGNIDGKVERFTYYHMKVGLGQTQLTGQLDIDGLPSLDETFINLNLKSGIVNLSDLRFVLPDEVYEKLRPLGRLRAEGKFIGFFSDFVANGKIETQLGKIKSNINLKIREDQVEESTYAGNLSLMDFDLGRYFEDTVNFQKVSLDGRINGKGLSEETANFLLNGTISSLGIRNYQYTNITTDAQFAKQLFNGQLTINDPNLKFNMAGSVDFRHGHEAVNITAKIDTMLFQELRLSSEKMFLSSTLDIRSRGLQVDSLFGRANLNHLVFTYRNNTLKLDSILLESTGQNQTRQLSLQSPLLDLNLDGNYYYSTLFQDVRGLFHEFYLNLKNDKKAIAAYYLAKNKRTQVYDVNLTANFRNINPVFALFGLDLAVSRNFTLDGRFSNGFTSIVHAFSKVDTVRYQDKWFFGSELEMNGSKVRDSTDVLASLTITSNNQEISESFKTKDLLMEAVWDGHHIDVGVDFDQDHYGNLLRLKSEIDFLQDSTKIKILPSRIRILDQEWVVNQSNYVLVQGTEWDVHALEIRNQDQSVALDGQISAQPGPEVKLSVSNLSVSLLNALSTEKFSGIMNGHLTARNLYQDPYLQNDISIRDFTVDKFLVGNITGTNIWNQNDHRFDIRFFIDRLEKRIINLSGTYDPSEKVNPLNVNATLENAHLKIAEPFLKGIFSQMGGTLTGNYQITGRFSETKIYGQGKISDGQIMIDYLKTLYQYTGTLGMTSDKIIFKDFALTDLFHHKATLNGFLEHKHFSNMLINLDASYTNFQVINTTARDNDLFYGQGYATGNVKIFGPIANMKITATARSQKNTKIYIPIKGSGEVEKKDFINFSHFTDSLVARSSKKKPKEKVELSGITMDLNLDITPDAFAEIIFDIKSGDIIRGRGNGNLKLQLDTKGEFNMFGVIDFTEGAYNFTLYDIINKEFSIKKGSRIAWFGDPYQATLNITASYRLLASLGPILQNQTVIDDPQVKRKYPVEVLLKLDGPMLSPQIAFDIDAKNLPSNVITEKSSIPLNFQQDFNAFKARLDEQELKKQVFSLIMLRRFSPYGESISTSGSIAGSVSELFSNQLSYWLSQVDQNLEINMDLKGLDQEAFNTFQLRLSYSFLNGRLRVTRDGTFNNQYNRSDISTIAGDWTVDYLLTPDGMFKVKMYSRTTGNSVNTTLGSQAAVTTGVSLLYTQNFDQILDLLRSAREKERRKAEQQNKNNPEAIKEDEEKKQ